MLTVTDLCDYIWCPYLVYLKKVKKIRPAPTQEMIEGTIRHKIYETLGPMQEVLLRSRIGQDDTLQDIEGIIENAGYQHAKNIALKTRSRNECKNYDIIPLLSDIKKEIRYEAIILAARIRMLAETNAMDHVADILFPPGDRELYIEDKAIGLKGRIDKVERMGGVVIPVDYKTGRPALQVYESQRMQLCAYALLLRRKEGVQVPIGIIDYTKSGTRIPVRTGKATEKSVLDTICKVNKIINKETIPVMTRKEKCKKCSFYEHCK